MDDDDDDESDDENEEAKDSKEIISTKTQYVNSLLFK